MILFVDLEHESRYDQPKTTWLLAARTRITYRLEDITGDRCLLQRYRRVSPQLMDDLAIRAVFISGQGTDRDQYDDADLAGLYAVITEHTVPVFGFCGGLQFMADALGVEIERVGRLADGEEDPFPEYQPGWRKELGYHPVDIVAADHPLTADLGPSPVFRHAHTWQLAHLPEGFELLARTDVTEAQFAATADGRLAGTQFHPEYWTDEHPAGRTLIANWCRMIGLID